MAARRISHMVRKGLILSAALGMALTLSACSPVDSTDDPTEAPSQSSTESSPTPQPPQTEPIPSDTPTVEQTTVTKPNVEIPEGWAEYTSHYYPNVSFAAPAGLVWAGSETENLTSEQYGAEDESLAISLTGQKTPISEFAPTSADNDSCYEIPKTPQKTVYCPTFATGMFWTGDKDLSFTVGITEQQNLINLEPMITDMHFTIA